MECGVVAGRLIGTHAHEVMSIVQHLMSHCDEEAGSQGKPVQVTLSTHIHTVHHEYTFIYVIYVTIFHKLSM